MIINKIVYKIRNLYFYLDLNQNNEFMYAIDRYEKKEIDFIIDKMKNFQKDGIFIDAGANIGLFSIFIAQSYPEVKVFSFEADKHNKERIIENLELNNIKNVQVENYGLAGETSIKEFSINTKHRGGNSFLKSDMISSDNIIKEEIKCYTLLDALSKNNILKIDILKMDIEGYEYPTLKEFLNNADKTLFPKYIVLEEWGNIIVNYNESVIELLIHNGYKLIDHYQDNFFFEFNNM